MDETLSERAEEALDRYAEECRRHELTRKERDAAIRERDGWIEASVSMQKKRDAANAARVAAEGELRRAKEALRWIADSARSYTSGDLHADCAAHARAALTPAPEAQSDGE